MYLDGVCEIGEEVAKSLSGMKYSLSLNGLQNLSDVAADYLAQKEGELEVESLYSSIPENISVSYLRLLLAGNHVDCIDLSRCSTFNDTLAAELKGFHGELNLSGLSELTEDAAKYLSDHEGNLILDGLESISEGVAEHLSCHKHLLLLRNLKHFSEATLKILARHKGQLISDKVKKAISEL